MLFNETALGGAFVIGLERKEDLRGHFARTFCVHEFEAHGLNPRVVQCNVSFNKRRGTLRGMHWQAPPSAEVKLVRAARGAIVDVIVDLRAGSPTYLQHIAVDLTEDNGQALYIPEGFAHGFQTLADDTEVFYQMSEFHAPEQARGARWNDPAFAISWPLPDPIMNDRDRTWPDYTA
ncbi:MAG TPA: dTDP-4-dehydrorhamnose 3,5-epimerase [Burkholderiales bacterium]|nr:dTDP-4-dehydrorhamnose 3,5-epimerase [Burkholderiales bacterium]